MGCVYRPQHNYWAQTRINQYNFHITQSDKSTTLTSMFSIATQRVRVPSTQPSATMIRSLRVHTTSSWEANKYWAVLRESTIPMCCSREPNSAESTQPQSKTTLTVSGSEHSHTEAEALDSKGLLCCIADWRTFAIVHCFREIPKESLREWRWYCSLVIWLPMSYC
jgi:hypothetical protein